MPIKNTLSFAILAPVPEHHLISGQEALKQQLEADDLPPGTLPKVAFGSMAFELFAQADQLRGDKSVEMLIYASHSTRDQPLNHEATWRASYIGHVRSRRGRYPGNARFRPASTATDTPDWAIFWEVRDLELLKTPVPIGKLQGMDKKTPYQPRFIPEGPVLIQYPSTRVRVRGID